jgi:glycosyltransferase involved in cell wall biosynthesis
MNDIKKNLISIIIPTLNEKEFIHNCINSVLKFEIPKQYFIEILIIDGMSVDGTREIIKNYCLQDQRIHLLDNPKVFQCSAINIGILTSKGEYILRLDAHSQYPTNYLTSLLQDYYESNADNVGGIFITKPGNDSFQATLVQALTTHPFGVGDAAFRTGGKAGYVDTVPYGFFKRALFNKLGLFDERLTRNEDYEFNQRLIKSGGKIWCNPDIHIYYYNQPTLIGLYKKQFNKEAPYNVYTWYIAPYTFAIRHAIPGLFTMSILAGIILIFISNIFKWIFIITAFIYSIFAIYASLQQAKRYKNIFHLLFLPGAFFIFHFIYGLGIISGLINLVLNRSPAKKKQEPWPGAGRFRAWPVK